MPAYALIIAREHRRERAIGGRDDIARARAPLAIEHAAPDAKMSTFCRARDARETRIRNS